MSGATLAIVAVVAFVSMEPITAATHRWVMHGAGWLLHRSHHHGAATRLEANDAFPVVFAAIVCLALAIGFNVDGWSALVPAGVGVTAYGAAYALVHDVYVHGRVRWFEGRTIAPLERLAACHRLHHRFGEAPYGMLAPVVPTRVRELASAAPAVTSRDRRTGRPADA